MTRLCPHVSLWLVAASVFTAAACSVDPLVITGRPCSEQIPCGQGATCDPTTLTCTKGGIADGGACPGGKTRCGDMCVDLASSEDHCGACDNWCVGSSDRCDEGRCVCGTTGAICANGLDCEQGSCRCVEGGDCDGCCDGKTCRLLGSEQSVSRCGAGGVACQSCSDGIACTTDSCQGDGSCASGVDPGHCMIQGTCHLEGTMEPSNPCRICQTSTSQTSWTATLAQGCVLTLAGDGTNGFKDGPKLAAIFDHPIGVAVDSKGTVYVADQTNRRIRKIENGVVSTLAGDGAYGFQDGPAAQAKFKNPIGVAVDSKGTVYVADMSNHRIRTIENGVVSTLTGGTPGYLDGPAAQAQLNEPSGVAVDNKGTVYITDYVNLRVRVVTQGIVSTLAGDGTNGFLDGPAATAQFASLQGLAVDPTGATVYVADLLNHRIRKIEKGMVTTVAGSGTSGFLDGPAAQAQFNTPTDVALAGPDLLFVSDSYNHRIRKITGGTVSTVAGDGSNGYRDGTAMQAWFSFPEGLAVGGDGVVYIVDGLNHSVRMLRP